MFSVWVCLYVLTFLKCHSRDVVEKEVTFLGLMVMQNQLKPETTGVIQELKDADIRTIMITGMKGDPSRYVGILNCNPFNQFYREG